MSCIRRIHEVTWGSMPKTYKKHVDHALHGRQLFAGLRCSTAWTLGKITLNMRPGLVCLTSMVHVDNYEPHHQMCRYLSTMHSRKWWDLKIAWHELCHALLLWQAWSEVESGVVKSLLSYCLDRFQRNPGVRPGVPEYPKCFTIDTW